MASQVLGKPHANLQMERKASQLLEKMQDPSVRHAAIRTLQAMGEDTAVSSSCTCTRSLSSTYVCVNYIFGCILSAFLYVCELVKASVAQCYLQHLVHCQQKLLCKTFNQQKVLLCVNVCISTMHRAAPGCACAGVSCRGVLRQRADAAGAAPLCRAGAGTRKQPALRGAAAAAAC